MAAIADTFPRRLLVIEELCDRALNATLALDSIDSLWPLSTDEAFLSAVRDDVEDGVTHTPFRWLGSAVNRPAWEASHMWWTIYFDREVVRALRRRTIKLEQAEKLRATWEDDNIASEEDIWRLIGEAERAEGLAGPR